MQKKLSYIWLFLLLFSLGACSIEEEIHFNKDFSGKLTRSLDFSGMMQMAKSLNPEGDSAKNPLEQGMPEELSPELDIEGIRNFKMNMDKEGAINLSFDFDNLDALNKAYNKLTMENMKNIPGLESMGSNGGGFTPGTLSDDEVENTETNTTPKPEHLYFARKGKNFYYYPSKSDTEENNEMEGSGMDLEGIGDMLKIETKFVFDRKIKKVSNNSTQIETFTDNTDNLLRLKMKLQGTQTDNKQPEIKIKLK